MAIDISELTASQKEDEVRLLEKRINSADGMIKRLTEQILEMTDEADAKARQRRTLYKEKHKAKFEKVDVRAALLGLPSRWSLKLYDAVYFFECPKGALSTEVLKFVQNPVIPSGDTPIDYSPIVPHEDILMRMMSGVQVPGQLERNFAGKPIVQKLQFLRELPEVLLNALSNQALTFQNYLDICLETDLGN